MSTNDTRAKAVRTEYDSLVRAALIEFISPDKDVRTLSNDERTTILRKLHTAYGISSSPSIMRLIRSFEKQYGGGP